MSRDLGDFQTPDALVALVLKRLAADDIGWKRVLEPTVGQGRFVSGLLAQATPPVEIHGFEIQLGHLEAARALVRDASVNIELTHASIFDVDLRRDLDWKTRGPLLVVGNPPWITNAELGSLGSLNLPKKSNIKRERGLDARTGRSNFDIAEAIWLKLLDELADQEPCFALLCKTSVARNVLEHAFKLGLPVGEAWMARIDARQWFKASVDACLFVLKIDPSRRAWNRIPIYESLEAVLPTSALGFANGRLVADIDDYQAFAFADGTSPLQWRQGIKHDAADLMELSPSASDFAGWRNKRGEVVDVEPEHVFPLLKGDDLSRKGPLNALRSVIVTQAKVGDDTRPLEAKCPKLWAYLRRNAADFAKRKSSIYQGGPEFAMFGVGPYSFSPYKVAVSGLNKSPIFHAVGLESGRPTLFDDTCYFLPCQTAEQASLLATLLNSSESLGLLRSLMLPGSKRPLTKSLLQRIDLSALLQRVDRRALLERAETVLRGLGHLEADWSDRIESFLIPDPKLAQKIDPFPTRLESCH